MEHLDDLAARADLAGPAAMHLHQHHVAAGGVAGPLLRNVDVGGAGARRSGGRRSRALVVLWPHETESLLGPLEDAHRLVLSRPGRVDLAPAAGSLAAPPGGCTRWLAP